MKQEKNEAFLKDDSLGPHGCHLSFGLCLSCVFVDYFGCVWLLPRTNRHLPEDRDTQQDTWTFKNQPEAKKKIFHRSVIRHFTCAGFLVGGWTGACSPEALAGATKSPARKSRADKSSTLFWETVTAQCLGSSGYKEMSITQKYSNLTIVTHCSSMYLYMLVYLCRRS